MGAKERAKERARARALTGGEFRWCACCGCWPWAVRCPREEYTFVFLEAGVRIAGLHAESSCSFSAYLIRRFFILALKVSILQLDFKSLRPSRPQHFWDLAIVAHIHD